MDALTLAMIQTILVIIIISIFSFALSCLTYFLDFCFEKGNIFDFYLPWLAKLLTKRRYPEKYDYILKSNKTEHNRLFIETASNYGPFKMLGGCSICFNVWIGFASLPLLNILLNAFIPFNLLAFWGIASKIAVCFFYILLSNFFLRKMRFD